MLFTRHVEKGAPPLVERVHSIHYDPQRTARIALVASGNQKRWLLATENMKAGDLITTSSEIPRIPGWKRIMKMKYSIYLYVFINSALNFA